MKISFPFAPTVFCTASNPVRAVEAMESNKRQKIMKKSAMVLALALGMSAWSLNAQDEGGPPPSGERPPGQEGGPGAQGGRARGQAGFHLLPPHVMEQLNLTADQQKQVAALEAEVKAKLEKILTPEQLKQMKQMRPPMRPSGPGGGPGGQAGPGGPGGQGGEGQPNSQRPPSE
jgi:Spy/CpxP family protein refolding chaperone